MLLSQPNLRFRIAFKYMGQGFKELYRSYRIKAQVELLQKFIPSLTVDDIEPKTYMAGIRAQALDENGIYIIAIMDSMIISNQNIF